MRVVESSFFADQDSLIPGLGNGRDISEAYESLGGRLAGVKLHHRGGSARCLLVADCEVGLLFAPVLPREDLKGRRDLLGHQTFWPGAGARGRVATCPRCATTSRRIRREPSMSFNSNKVRSGVSALAAAVLSGMAMGLHAQEAPPSAATGAGATIGLEGGISRASTGRRERCSAQ